MTSKKVDDIPENALNLSTNTSQNLYCENQCRRALGTLFNHICNISQITQNQKQSKKYNTTFSKWPYLLMAMLDVFQIIQTNPNFPWESLAQDYLTQNNFPSVNIQNYSDPLIKLKLFLFHIYEQSIQRNNNSHLSPAPSKHIKEIIKKMLSLANQLTFFYNSNNVNLLNWNDFWNILRTKGDEITSQTKLKILFSVFNTVLTDEALYELFSEKEVFEEKLNNVLDYFKNTKKPLINEGLNTWDHSQPLNQTLSNICQQISSSSQNSTINAVITTPAWISKFGLLNIDVFKIILPINGLERLEKSSQSEALLESFICINQSWLQNDSQLTAKIMEILSDVFNCQFIISKPLRQIIVVTSLGNKVFDVLVYGCGNNEWYPVIVEIWSLVVIKIIFLF